LAEPEPREPGGPRDGALADPPSGNGRDEDRMAMAYARARARDAEARAQLRPLGPDERPAPLVVAVVVAALIAVANLVLLAAGWDVDGQDPSTPGVLLFGALMLAAAVGMWQRRYGAVLAFEALLAIGVTYAGLSLLVATNAAAIALCLAVLIAGGTLFWKLVRVMARIQATTRRPSDPVG
jgi:hypothetical protein